MSQQSNTPRRSKRATATTKGAAALTAEERAAAPPRDRQNECAVAHVEDLVRDAGVCQGWQGRLLFQSAAKFKARYATVGFTEKANVDDGNMLPTYFALKKLAAAEEKTIAGLVKKAVS